jgi:Ca2+-binding RTX toxin-like protein
VDGGDGNDTINGGDGADSLLGGNGDDFIDGNRGNDTAILGAGDDVFQWDPGDGNDVVEGQDGRDTMVFNGANIGEQINLSANGERLRLVRDIGPVTMDTNDVEVVSIKALGGTDTITVNDLSGTDVVEVNVDLSAAPGVGDNQVDNVIVNGTNNDDVIVAAGDATGASVFGLTAQVNITGGEAANDQLNIFAVAGDDVVEGSGLADTALSFVVDAGAGDDVLIGGARADVLHGGDGDDVLMGGPGTDVLDGGNGDNTLIQG